MSWLIAQVVERYVLLQALVAFLSRLLGARYKKRWADEVTIAALQTSSGADLDADDLIHTVLASNQEVTAVITRTKIVR